MATCKSCGKQTVWVGQDDGKWLMFNSIVDGGGLHFKTCKPNPEYIKLREKLLKSVHRPEKIQIGEEEFI